MQNSQKMPSEGIGMDALPPERPLRICFYTTRALPKHGGQEVVVDALARKLVEAGQYVVVLAPSSKHASREFDRSLSYQVVRHPRFISTRWFISLYRRFLISLQRSHGFDIIHCHGIHPAGYLAAIGQKHLKTPLVITNHSGNLECDPAWMNKPVIRERHLFTMASVDALLAPNRHTTELLRRLSPESPLIMTMPNGIDLESFNTHVPLPSERFPGLRPGKYALVLSRLRNSKGIDLPIKALASLRRVQDFSLVVAGTGHERTALTRLAETLGLEKRVLFPGWISGSVKLSLLQNALCSVLPSREAEGFGLVALESFCAGRPVLASRVPGLIEIVSDGSTGLVFERDSVEGLAQALHTLIADRDLADRLGANAKNYSAPYQWNTIADQHLRLYRSLCGSARTRTTRTNAFEQHGCVNRAPYAPLAHS